MTRGTVIVGMAVISSLIKISCRSTLSPLKANGEFNLTPAPLRSGYYVRLRTSIYLALTSINLTDFRHAALIMPTKIGLKWQIMPEFNPSQPSFHRSRQSTVIFVQPSAFVWIFSSFWFLLLIIQKNAELSKDYERSELTAFWWLNWLNFLVQFREGKNKAVFWL